MSTPTFSERTALAIGRQLANPSGVSGTLLAAAMRVANRRPTRALIEALDIRDHHRVLDVGCGDGTALAALGHVAWRCGVDPSETMLAVARRRFRRTITQGRLDLRRGGMDGLPVAAGTFDRIIASNVLYFCADVPAFVDECRRVATPGALLGIYVTAAGTMVKWRFAGPATHRHFTEQGLAAELQLAGVEAARFRILRTRIGAGIDGLVAVVRLP